MKLIFTPNPGYVHKVLVTAHEAGVLDRLELERQVPFDARKQLRSVGEGEQAVCKLPQRPVSLPTHGRQGIRDERSVEPNRSLQRPDRQATLDGLLGEFRVGRLF
ncbi:MAG: hypothetical protein IIA98_05595 [Proteobacteria bacterium]|nr:hypothetical protein [Pseudomonadota bacterium]